MEQSKRTPARSHPPLITVTGLKRSGKTAVVEAIISELCQRGYRVGTIKTARHHPAPRDAERTDTRRHAEAGASVVVGLYADGMVCLERGAPPADIGQLSRHFPASVDILISEGLVDPREARNVVVCVQEPAELEEALRTRGISPDSIVAISGAGAGAWAEQTHPAFDVTVPTRRKALVDLLLNRVQG